MTEEGVSIILDACIANDLFELLKVKINTDLEQSFSTRFEYVATLGDDTLSQGEQYSMCIAWDVKISHRHHCIAVSDFTNNRIQFFDLKTREYKATLSTTRPMFLCIEKNYKNDASQHDALIFGTYTNCIYKYDLDQVLRGEECEPIWMLGTPDEKGSRLGQFIFPQGIAMCYSRKYDTLLGSQVTRDDRLLFVCDNCNHRVQVLRSSDGKVLESFGVRRNDEDESSQKTLELIEFNGPNGIDLDENDNLIVAEYNGERIQIIGRSGEDGQLTVLNSIMLNTQPCLIRNVVYDRIARNLVISDCEAHTISVLDFSGKVVACFGSYGYAESNHFVGPCGLCLNELTGELYVADSANNRIQIFK